MINGEKRVNYGEYIIFKDKKISLYLKKIVFFLNTSLIEKNYKNSFIYIYIFIIQIW